MPKRDPAANRIGIMSRPTTNTAPAKGLSVSPTTSTTYTVPARFHHRPISPSATSLRYKGQATSYASAMPSTSPHGKSITTTRPATAPTFAHEASVRQLEAYLPRLQTAANRVIPEALSGASASIPEDRVPRDHLPSSPLKTIPVVNAVELVAHAARSQDEHKSSPMRGYATLAPSPASENWAYELSEEERGCEGDQQTASPLHPLAGLPQRTQELCEEVITLDSLVEADELFFSAQADMESHILEVLESWREAASASAAESCDGSRRASGLYALSTVSSPPALGTQLGDVVTHSSGGSGSGAQRVLQDLDEARDRITLLADFHEKLARLEEQHRELHKRYLVERSPLLALDEVCARLDEIDEEVQEDGDRAGRMRAMEPIVRGTHRVSESDILRRRERDAARAGLAACRLLADRLRSRCRMISSRLADGLLGSSPETTRHGWTALLSSTPLTRMDRVVFPKGLDDSSITGASASRCVSHFLTPEAVEAVRQSGRYSGVLTFSNHPSEFLERSENAAVSGGDESNQPVASADTVKTREMFILSVQVPVFPSATQPALSCFPPPAGTTKAEGASIVPASGDVFPAVRSAERVQRRSSGMNDAPSNAHEATVSVMATPARYALVQLYECCRDGLATMLSRFYTLRERRSKEVERVQQEQSAMDVYDPAADDLFYRCTSLLSYVEQLDKWAGKVRQLDKALHEHVKLPLDAALQTHERLRTQLLEVLRQRLNEEECDNERTTASAAAAAAVDAEADGGEVDGRGEDASQYERVRHYYHEDAHALQGEGGKVNRTNHHYTPSSVGDLRAQRVTQPSATALSRTAPPTALPRASAEFIGMLETLAGNPQASGEPLFSTSTVLSEVTAGGELEGSTCGRGKRDNVPSEETSPIEPRSSVTEGHDEGTSTPMGMGATLVAGPLGATSATSSHIITEGVPGGAKKGREATGTLVVKSSEGVDAGHLAGRRRQREESEDESGDVCLPSVSPHTAAHTHTTLSGSTSAAAPPGEITVYISSTSCSESGEGGKGGVAEEVGTAQNTVDTGDGMPRQSNRIEHGPVLSADTDNSDGSGSEGGDPSQGSHDIDTDLRQRQPQPQRYALGSGSGLGQGLRAFFSAVVRRAMKFDDSNDDDDEETGLTATFSDPQKGSTSPLLPHKRFRQEE
ncbi:hypothetical protein JKF63_07489 [Porcisia hertigi]|uniref:Uncharacterized protein n=1 Tax=Porcisia hertigi TaxID=2761500 RepID=A0A836IHV7_9TRYP|nr:hypothetical protein JKF63_07489 [Porcisia hertigi]